MFADGVVEEDADEGFAVLDFAGVDEAEDFGEGGHVDLDFFIFLGGGLAEGETFGEEDGHGFGEEAGAGVVVDVFGPAFGAVAGFFDELALAGGDELFAGLDAAGGEFEEELAGGVAVLSDEEDAGIGGIGFGVDGEDDDGAVVADDVAGGLDAAGLDDLIFGDPEDVALVYGFGGEGFAAAGELEGLGWGGCFGGCWRFGGGFGGCFGGCFERAGFGESHARTVHDGERGLGEKSGRRNWLHRRRVWCIQIASDERRRLHGL